MAMRWMAAGAGALALAACMQAVRIGSAPDGGSMGAGTGGSGGGGETATVGEMARLVNARREGRGCPALAWLQPAAEAAQAHSADMARRDFFDHVSPDGQQPRDRVSARGVRFRMLAENIAWTPGQGARATLQGWIESGGHRENLDNCAYTHHGIGLHEGYWTHVFVTPLESP